MTAKYQALVLAAGKGTRMKSELPKVVHPILGKPMVAYVIEAVKSVGCKDVILITGYKSNLVKEALSNYQVDYVEQPEQLGTGHAVQCYARATAEKPQNLLVVCGDTPLISVDTLNEMIRVHEEQKPAVTMMTLQMQEPGNYGRVLRKDGLVTAIREAKDCSNEELQVNEVNLAVYIFESEFLFSSIFSLTSNNRQNEYYLTDLIEAAVKQNKKVLAVVEKDESSTLGINSRQHLAQVSDILQQQILEKHMSAGVTVTSPQTTFIGPDVEIAADTTIHPNTMLHGKTRIGSNCVIGPGCRISDSAIGSDSIAEFCVITRSTVADSSRIEPFSLIEG